MNTFRYQVPRYSNSSFLVEELPQLPDIRAGHACLILPNTGVRLTSPQTSKDLQALVVAGGNNGWVNLASMLSLLPGSEFWLALTPLPRALYGARALIVGGRLRLTGGRDDGGAFRSEVRDSLS